MMMTNRGVFRGKTIMTKDEIMKIIENKSNIEIDPNGNDWWEIRGENIFYIADEICTLMEQEKKKEINKVLKNSPGVTYIDISEQFVKECETEIEKAKKEAVREFAKDLIRQANFWGENDNMWFNYETLKKVVKEYGVEL